MSEVMMMQLRKIAELQRSGQAPRMSSEQLTKLHHLKQGNFTATITEEEDSFPPRFQSSIQDVEVFVDEGEPVVFEARIEPKHDLNLSVRWYHDDEELVSGGRFRITHEFGYVAINIFYTYPEDEGLYICRATNELGEDETSARLICRSLPHIRFNLPALEPASEEDHLNMVMASLHNHRIDARVTPDALFSEGGMEPPRFLAKMENFPKLLTGQSVKLETFVVPVGDPSMSVEWYCNGKPLLFKSNFSPIYEFGYVALSMKRVYPDDFGEFRCRIANQYGVAEMTGWVGEMPASEETVKDEEPDLPAWCNKVEKGRLAVECPPEITKHLVDMEVGETDSAKLEVHFIGKPSPDVIWTHNGKAMANSRHVQLREKEGKTSLILINVTRQMAGEYRMVVSSQLGQDRTVARVRVVALPPEKRQLLDQQRQDGLQMLVRYEEDKLMEKKRKVQEKEEKLKNMKEKAKNHFSK